MTALRTQGSIAGVAVRPGTRQVHRFVVAETHGGFTVDVPMHLVFGAKPGATVVVHAGLSGLEIEPALALPGWVAGLDPSELAGNVVVIPLLNLSGFEFEQVAFAWDGLDLNAAGAGRSDGTVGERLLDAYKREVVDRADALIDVRTGSQWSYSRYAGVHDVGSAERVRTSMDLAVAAGLPHAALGEPVGATFAGAVAAAGIPTVTLWVGGGPGLRDHRARDAAALGQALDGVLGALGIREAAPVPAPAPRVQVHTVVRTGAARGLTFMDASLRGTSVQAGAVLGHVRHPFEGHVVEEIVSLRAGVVLHAGASWPMVPEGAVLAMLADPI